MKLLRTKGRGAQQAAETLAALERRGAASLDAVLPAAKRIVADVHKKGDHALLRYATQFDGLAGADALRVTSEEMAAAWATIDPALRDALTTAAKQIRKFAQEIVSEQEHQIKVMRAAVAVLKSSATQSSEQSHAPSTESAPIDGSITADGMKMSR